MKEAEGTIASEGKSLEAGDVVEVELKRGLAYLQVTHLHATYPEVVRVLAGIHEARPDDLKLLVKLPTRFHAITPLSVGGSRRQLPGEVIGRFAVPASDQEFPRFRTPVRDRAGEVVYWWLWDGETLSHVELGDDDCITAMPIREVVSFDALLQRLDDEL